MKKRHLKSAAALGLALGMVMSVQASSVNAAGYSANMLAAGCGGGSCGGRKGGVVAYGCGAQASSYNNNQYYNPGQPQNVQSFPQGSGQYNQYPQSQGQQRIQGQNQQGSGYNSAAGYFTADNAVPSPSDNINPVQQSPSQVEQRLRERAHEIKQNANNGTAPNANSYQDKRVQSGNGY